MTQPESDAKTVARAARELILTEKYIGGAAMIVWRIIGWIVFLAGLSVLVRDVVAWFDTKIWAPIALGQLWYELDRSSLNLVQAVIQRYLSPFLWDRIILNILLCWASAVLIVIGASILLLTRARRRQLRI
jgi:hypothetical protein